jgi:hypothetical protein
VLIQVLDGNELEVSALSAVHYDLIHIADRDKCRGSRILDWSAECHKANFSSNIAYFQCISLTISDKHNLHCRFGLARLSFCRLNRIDKGPESYMTLILIF